VSNIEQAIRRLETWAREYLADDEAEQDIHALIAEVRRVQQKIASVPIGDRLNRLDELIKQRDAALAERDGGRHRIALLETALGEVSTQRDHALRREERLKAALDAARQEAAAAQAQIDGARMVAKQMMDRLEVAQAALACLKQAHDIAQSERERLGRIYTKFTDEVREALHGTWGTHCHIELVAEIKRRTANTEVSNAEIARLQQERDAEATNCRLMQDRLQRLIDGSQAWQQERERLIAWQPISTAPTDGTTVLLTDGHYVRTGYYARRINVWSVDTTVALPIPTRWCAIPPPTETQEPTR